MHVLYAKGTVIEREPSQIPGSKFMVTVKQLMILFLYYQTYKHNKIKNSKLTLTRMGNSRKAKGQLKND